MSSSFVLTKEEVDQLKNSFFPPDGNGDVSLSILENALRSVKISATQEDLNRIIEELQGLERNEDRVQRVIRIVEEKRKNVLLRSEKTKRIAMYSVGTLIEDISKAIGEILSPDKMDDIIKEGGKRDCDVDGIVSILADEQVSSDYISEDERGSENILLETKRRMACLGVIIRAIGKSMTQEDLLDILMDDIESRGECGNANYHTLLVMAKQKKESLSEDQEEVFKLQDEEYITSLEELQSVLLTLGHVMIVLSKTLRDHQVKLFVEESSTEKCGCHEIIIRMLERELSCEDNTDVINEFNALYRRGSGRFNVSELRETLKNSRDAFTDDEIDELLMEAGISEDDEINFNDLVQRMETSWT